MRMAKSHYIYCQILVVFGVVFDFDESVFARQKSGNEDITFVAWHGMSCALDKTTRALEVGQSGWSN